MQKKLLREELLAAAERAFETGQSYAAENVTPDDVVFQFVFDIEDAEGSEASDEIMNGEDFNVYIILFAREFV